MKTTIIPTNLPKKPWLWRGWGARVMCNRLQGIGF
jgi:hypothetical protein